eukprot:141843_1
MAAQGCCEKNSNRIGVCCFMDEDAFKHKPLAEVVQNSDRQCTDVPCCLGLLAAFISQFVLIGYAMGQGANPSLLMRGYDFRGNLCEPGYEDGAITAWPALAHSEIKPLPTNLMICVDSCTQTTKQGDSPLMVGGDYYSSYTFLNEWCIPSNPSNFSSYSHFSSSQAEYERAVADISITKWLILASSFVGIVLAFIYLRLVACVGRLLIWLTILVVSVGGIMLAVLLLQTGIKDSESASTDDMGKVEIILGGVLLLIVVMIWLSLWFIRKRIKSAIEMLHEASHCINDMKSTLIFPCIYSLVGLIYLTFWIFILLYIYSVQTKEAGNIPNTLVNIYEETTTFVYYKFDTTMQHAVIYHFVCLFYFVQVIIYFGFMVLAGAIADWYFSEWNSEKNAKVRGYNTAELSYSPIWESFFRVLRFHMGSLALGALIITFIRVLRAIVKYIETKTKGAQNPVTKCMFCCVQCCLRCCQCVFDRISKEGFIFTTVYGTAYCYSSFQALKILTHNIGRAMIVEGVSHYTELFGRIAIASLNCGVAVGIMFYLPFYQAHVSSVIFPATIIFVISYMIASFFMLVLSVAVDTLFLCFLIDETVHDQPRFASHKMRQMTSVAHEEYQRMKSQELEEPLHPNKGQTRVQRGGSAHVVGV